MGIQEFCRQHNLKTDGIHQLCQGNLLTYKGWICLTTNVRKKKIYKIKYLNEKPISIIEGKISEFCRLNNLDAAAMNNVFEVKV